MTPKNNSNKYDAKSSASNKKNEFISEKIKDDIFSKLDYAQMDYDRKLKRGFEQKYFSDDSFFDASHRPAEKENPTEADLNAVKKDDKKDVSKKIPVGKPRVNKKKYAKPKSNKLRHLKFDFLHKLYEKRRRKGEKVETEDTTENYYSNRDFFLLKFDLVKDMQIMIKRHYKKVIYITGVFVAIISVYLFLLNFNTSSMNISFRYAEMEKGLNPDGTRFNIYEILSDDVLGQVVEKLNNEKITVKYLRNRLIIVDSIPAATQEKIVQSVLDGYENFAYMPSDYTVSYSQVFGPFGARKILSVLSDVYSEYFVSHHVANTKVLQPDFSGIENTDYINSVEKLTGQLNSILLYLQNRKNDDVKFVSSETGKSFGDLSAVLDKIISVDLEAYRSYIIKSSLTTDKAALVRQLHYAISLLEQKYQDDSATYDVLRDGLEKYDQTVTKVVFIPTLDKQNEYYMARTNTGIDYLTEKAEEKSESMQEISKSIEQYKYLIESFRNELPNDTENLSDAELAASKATADKLLNSIIQRTEDICNLALKTEEEYIKDKEKSYPVFGVTLFGLGLSSNVKYLVMGGIVGLIGSFVFVVVLEKIIRIIKKILMGGE